MELTNALLFKLLAAEVAALLLVAVFVFGNALLLRWKSRRLDPLLAGARDALLAALHQGTGDVPSLDGQLRQILARLPTDELVKLVAGLATSLDGGQRATLTHIALQLGLVARAERECSSLFWWKRLHGCRLLTLMGKGEPIVPKLLDDRHPDVRAQAIEWAAGHPTPEIVSTLVMTLAAPADPCRFSVQDTLLRLGGAAIEPLASYLTTHGGRPAETALQVAIGLADPRFLAPALSLCRDPEPRVRALATTLIGALGGDESSRILLELLDDPADEVRAAASAALGRLGHTAAAPALARRLRDRAWEVRRAAGLALRDFGAPGLLYLRRALADPDPFAADMARQLLDLIALAGETA